MAGERAPRPGRIFAIQITERTAGAWNDDGSTARYSYRWDDVAVSGKSGNEAILIAVARRYPEASPVEVRRIASAIYQHARLKTGDGIVAYHFQDHALKTGIITSFASDPYGIDAEIAWGLWEVPIEGVPDAMDREAGIQEITPRFIAEARSAGPTEAYSEKSLPAHKHEHGGGLSTSVEVQKQDPGGVIELFYATNRGQTGAQEANNFYDGELSTMKLGRCEVSIPPGHRQGELERPRRILGWQFNENKNRHVMLASVRELPEALFTSLLQSSLEASPGKSALVFIHGYNTSFAEAAWRAGQLAYDIPFNDGIACFFSWPSTARTVDYFRDGERVEASAGDLVRFIEVLVQQAGVKHLHFVAHSMGNRVLTRALKELSAKPSFKSRIGSICQIVLAAPDIDRDVFERDIMPAFSSVGTRRTLYSSDEDKAMWVSRTLRRGLPRIGDAGEHLYVAAGVDTVDASNVSSPGNHHSYVFECKELLADVYALLTQNPAPAQRRLKSRKKGGLDYWLFPG